MKKSESGRTLVETLAVIAIIGILSISGLQLYSKAMNTIRANYIMEQVYIMANELRKDPVANRAGRGKMVDVTVRNEGGNLSYGYQIDTAASRMARSDITVKLDGFFPRGVCRILKKKIASQEYAGLKQIEANATGLKENNCPAAPINSMTFTIDSAFRHQNL